MKHHNNIRFKSMHSATDFCSIFTNISWGRRPSLPKLFWIYAHAPTNSNDTFIKTFINQHMKMHASKYSDQHYYLIFLETFELSEYMDASISCPLNGALILMSILIHFKFQSLSSTKFSVTTFFLFNLFSLFTIDNCLTEKRFLVLVLLYFELRGEFLKSNKKDYTELVFYLS